MLRIDLLPRQIRDRRRVPLYLAICGVIFVMLALGLGVYVIGLTTEVSSLQREVTDLAAKAKEVDDLNAQVTALEKTASLAGDRVAFVDAVRNTGPAWAAYISELSRWVPASAYLSSWSIDGGKLEWKGILLLDPYKGLTSDDYMRFLIHIRRCPLLSNASLTIEGLESGFSYPDGSSSYMGGESFVPFTVTGTLQGAPAAPEFKAAAAPAAAPAAQAPAAGAGAGAATGAAGAAPSAGAAKPPKGEEEG